MTRGDAVIAGALGWQKAQQERDEWKARAEKVINEREYIQERLNASVQIRESLKAENKTLRAEIEDERLRVVACGVAAMSNTEKSIAANRLAKDHPLWCASYGDVCNAVDREMRLRAALAELCCDSCSMEFSESPASCGNCTDAKHVKAFAALKGTP